MKENGIKVVFAAAIAGLTAYFGKLAIPLLILLVVMIGDYITGMTKAWVTKQISSRIGIIGIIKKLSYLLVVCVGMVVDWVISSALIGIGIDFSTVFSFGIVVAVWLIINELISILENLGTIGVPLPAFLSKIVSKLKQTVDNKVDGNINEEDISHGD